jgi:hypothetical protein
MAGVVSFQLNPNQVSLAPGAICDHFTSFGAVFDKPGQTKLSAWLRAGAAGASGTVTEPFAIQAKFPLPSMHLHYRRGASLAEAFYQSVSGPYQLLIVGDPLCQPWAKPPKVQLEGVEPGSTVSGTVTLKANIEPAPGTEVEQCELFIDGGLVARYPAPLPVPLDTSKLAAGRHELRLVAATADDLEFRGRAVVPLEVRPQDASGDEKPLISLEVSPAPMVPAGASIRVTVAGPAGTAAYDILQNHRRVARVEGASGSVEIDARLLGRGPVSLVAQVAGDDEQQLPPAARASRSAPQWLLVR